MTMEERLNSLLSETEDVAEKDKIYLNGLVRGGSEMAADRPYYKVPFSEGLRDAVDPAKKNERSPVFVTTTGSILQKLGFTALPMMMNRRHLRLNYYSRENFERIYGKIHEGENAHALGLNLEKIVSALEHPLAVVVNTRENAKAGSVVVITDINVNGKKVVVPVLVEAVSQAKNQDIDAHLVLTVYDSKDWMGDFLEPAVEIEKSGKPGVFFTDPKKAGKYSALSLGKKGTVLSGFTGHTIQDIGINVKSQSETLQFKSWSGDSKVVDESGKPLVVYHGTNWDGWEFDTENGAFFSEKEDYAEEMAAQRGGSRIVKAYLSIKNPLVVKVPGNKMADPEFEARIIAEAKSKGHDGVKLETDTNNEIEKDVFWVAFEPNQIKSATDNVGTFDPGNPDVRFSVAPDDAFVQAWAKVLLPVVSTQYINADAAAAYLMDHGIEVYAGRDDDTLRKACVLAQQMKKDRNKVTRGNREHKALEKKDPYYKILSGKFGRDFQINAGPKYDGTVFTGTWMDKHKTEKGRSGSITAAEAAKILTESTGKEVTEAVVVERQSCHKKIHRRVKSDFCGGLYASCFPSVSGGVTISCSSYGSPSCVFQQRRGASPLQVGVCMARRAKHFNFFSTLQSPENNSY